MLLKPGRNVFSSESHWWLKFKFWGLKILKEKKILSAESSAFYQLESKVEKIKNCSDFQSLSSFSILLETPLNYHWMIEAHQNSALALVRIPYFFQKGTESLAKFINASRRA